jgi:hypothetical protein
MLDATFEGQVMIEYEAFEEKLTDILKRRSAAIHRQRELDSRIRLLQGQIGGYVSKHNKDALMGDGRSFASIAPKSRERLECSQKELAEAQDLEDTLWEDYLKLRSDYQHFARLFDEKVTARRELEGKA